MSTDTLYTATGSQLTAIADAIREKGGTNASLSFPSGFVSAIGEISGGGGSANDYVKYAVNVWYYSSNDGYSVLLPSGITMSNDIYNTNNIVFLSDVVFSDEENQEFTIDKMYLITYGASIWCFIGGETITDDIYYLSINDSATSENELYIFDLVESASGQYNVVSISSITILIKQ